MTQAFWNERFAMADYKYGRAPNAFLRAQAHRLAPGSRVLVPGDGEGRNGVWLASRGHEVWAVDYAQAGLAKGRQLAEASGRAVAERFHTLHADLTEWSPTAGPWDAVVLIYCHLPSAQRQVVHRRLAAALRPGAWFLLEAFEPAQLAWSSGGPKDVDMLVSPDDLRRDLDGLVTFETLEPAEVMLDEGPGHQGEARVVRCVARRLD